MLSVAYGCKVEFQVKSHPWFVSDTTISDFEYLINQCEEFSEFGLNMLKMTDAWRGFLKDGTWILNVHDFWTTPYTFSQLENAPDLYSHLSKADLLIFKGDLNYRKVSGKVT
jgi:hypothetical protein